MTQEPLDAEVIIENATTALVEVARGSQVRVLRDAEGNEYIDVEFTVGQRERINANPGLEDELRRRIIAAWHLAERTAAHGDLAHNRSKRSVLGNSYEDNAWALLKLDERVLTACDEEGKSLLPTWESLSNDCYSLLRRREPTLLDLDQIRRTHHVNRLLTGLTHAGPEFSRLHDLTIGDDAMTVLAAEQIEKEWLDILRNAQGSGACMGVPLPGSGGANDPQQSSQEHSDAADAAQDLLSDLEGLLDEGNLDDIDAQIAQIEQQLAEADALAESLQSPGESAENPLDLDAQDEDINGAVQKALDALREVNETFRLWGVNQEVLKTKDPKEVLALYRQLRASTKLRHIAEILGHQRIAIHSREERTTHSVGVEEKYDVGFGRKLNRMTPSQKALLYHAPQEFARRYLDGKLINWMVRGLAVAERGKAVGLLDLSGSMTMGSPYSYEEIGKATMISVLEYMQEEERGLDVIFFDHGVRQRRYLAPGFKPDELLQAKLWIASTSYGGGTDFFAPIMAGLISIEQEPYLENADMFIITDGQCTLNKSQLEEVQKRQDEQRVKLQTILMPGGKAGVLAKLGDVFNVRTALQEAVDLALGIVQNMDKDYKGRIPQDDDKGVA